jgi:hypothetical protein
MVAPLIAMGGRMVLGKAVKKLAKSKLGKKIMGGVAKATGGMLGGKAGVRKKRGFSIARLQKRMISAKINAKIQKIRLSAFKGL